MKKYCYHEGDYCYPIEYRTVTADNLRGAKKKISKKEDVDFDMDDIILWEVKGHPPKTFYKRVDSSNLEAAVSFFFDCCREVYPSVEFIGFKEVYPYELLFKNPFNPKNRRRAQKKKSFGWGKRLLPERLQEKFNNDTERCFGHIFESKKIDPIIEINGQICDGMGRLMMCHALGIKVKVAVYKYDK